MRERPTNRRPTLTATVGFGNEKLHVSFGTFSDGRLQEIFSAGPKVGSDLRTSIQEAVTAASFALQYGASPEEILRALPRTVDDKPDGALATILEAWVKICEPLAPPNSSFEPAGSISGTGYLPDLDDVATD